MAVQNVMKSVQVTESRVRLVENAFKKVFGLKAAPYLKMFRSEADWIAQNSIAGNYTTNPNGLVDSVVYIYFCVGKQIIEKFSSAKVVYVVDGDRTSFTVQEATEKVLP